MNLASQLWQQFPSSGSTWMTRLLAGCLIFCACCATSHAQAPDFDANQAELSPGEVVNLEDQLINGLRVVTTEQRTYVLQIVALVNQGVLPRAMVNVVYSWAIKRNPRVPLPYFQFALKALAERRGISVPDGQFIVN